DLVVAGGGGGELCELLFVLRTIETPRFEADEDVVHRDHVEAGTKVADRLIPVVGAVRELRLFLRRVATGAVHAVAVRVREIGAPGNRRVRGRVVVAERGDGQRLDEVMRRRELGARRQD